VCACCGAVHEVEVEQAVLVIINPATTSAHSFDQIFLRRRSIVVLEANSRSGRHIHKGDRRLGSRDSPRRRISDQRCPHEFHEVSARGLEVISSHSENSSSKEYRFSQHSAFKSSCQVSGIRNSIKKIKKRDLISEQECFLFRTQLRLSIPETRTLAGPVTRDVSIAHKLA